MNMPHAALPENFLVGNLQLSAPTLTPMTIRVATMPVDSAQQIQDMAPVLGLASRTEKETGLLGLIHQHPKLCMAVMLGFALVLLAAAAWSLCNVVGKRKTNSR